MKAISIADIKRLAFNMLIIIILICLAGLPVTYSHFIAKAGTDELVLETALWDLELEDEIGPFPDSSHSPVADIEENHEDEVLHD